MAIGAWVILALLTALFAVLIFAVVRVALAGAKITSVTTRTDDAATQLTGLRFVLQQNATPGGADALLRPLVLADPNFASDAFLEWAKGAIATQVGAPVTQASIEAVRIDAQQQVIVVHAQGASFDRRAIFVRPAGATTALGGTPHDEASLATANCPSCGAQITRGIAACPYCGIRLDQAGVSWSLASLVDPGSQSSQPAPAQSGLSVTSSFGLLLAATRPGQGKTVMALGNNLPAAVDELRARDPNFSRDQFMRWATGAYLTQRQKRDGSRVAIQKADLFMIMIDYKTESAAVLFVARAMGVATVTEAAVFARPVGTQTPPLSAVKQSVCANCGAPLGQDDVACSACGVAIESESGGWKLDQITDHGHVGA
jgi:hypothetical protein